MNSSLDEKELLDISNTCNYFWNTFWVWRVEKANLNVFHGIRNYEEIWQNSENFVNFICWSRGGWFVVMSILSSSFHLYLNLLTTLKKFNFNQTSGRSLKFAICIHLEKYVHITWHLLHLSNIELFSVITRMFLKLTWIINIWADASLWEFMRNFNNGDEVVERLFWINYRSLLSLKVVTVEMTMFSRLVFGLSDSIVIYQ